MSPSIILSHTQDTFAGHSWDTFVATCSHHRLINQLQLHAFQSHPRNTLLPLQPQGHPCNTQGSHATHPITHATLKGHPCNTRLPSPTAPTKWSACNNTLLPLQRQAPSGMTCRLGERLQRGIQSALSLEYLRPPKNQSGRSVRRSW